MVKIKILYARKWGPLTGQDGIERSGFTYGGTRENGVGITFSSPNLYEIGKIVEVELNEKWDERQNKIKYSERVI